MADSSSTHVHAPAAEQAAATCGQDTPSYSEASSQKQGDEQVDELSALREQYQLQQQEVTILQAQVERLSSVLESSSSSEQDPGRTSSSGFSCSHLQQQLHAAHSELQHTRALQEQCMQESSAAIKSACAQRSGALRLLLAEQAKELRELEQEKAAAQQLAMDKAEDCEAMRTALAAANAHILLLTAQQQQQQGQTSCSPQDPPVHLDASTLRQHSTAAAAGSGPATAHAQTAEPGASCSTASPRTEAATMRPSRASQAGTSGTEAASVQEDVLQELQQQLAVRQQQLDLANEQIKDLVQHLALKRDAVQFAEQRAAMLQHQLEAAQAAVAAANLAAAAAAAAAPPDPQQHRRSCTSIAELDDPDLSTDGDNNSSSSPQRPQQQQQHAEQQPIKSMSLADSLSAAFSNATNGFNLSGSKGDSAEHEQQQQAPRQQTPSPMSPFGLARKFVADREADAVARLKDELREREQEVASLTAATRQADIQLEGLHTILVTKLAQCARLDKELKEARQQARQAEATAAAEVAAARQVAEQAGEQVAGRVAGLQEALGVAQQREAVLEGQLLATRRKLAQVLDALAEDAAAQQQHQPALHKLVLQDMPAAWADVMATAAAATRQGSSSTSSGGNGSAHPARTSSTTGSNQHSSMPGLEHIPAARAASMPLDTLDTITLDSSITLGGPSTSSILTHHHHHHHQQQQQVASTSSGHGVAGGAPEGDSRPFGLRSFMRSRTLSNMEGSASSTQGVQVLSSSLLGGPPKGGVLKGSVWGPAAAAASAAERQQATGGNGSVLSGVSTPRQGAAAQLDKLFETLRLGRKGKEGQQEAEGAAGGRRLSRTTGSGDYSYVLLDS